MRDRTCASPRRGAWRCGCRKHTHMRPRHRVQYNGPLRNTVMRPAWLAAVACDLPPPLAAPAPNITLTMHWPAHLPPCGAPCADRTYVVLAYPLPLDPRAPLVVLGTVRAPGRRAAHAAAMAVAVERLAARAARGTRKLPAGDYAVRWRAAGACRRAWLLDALAQDGAAASARMHA